MSSQDNTTQHQVGHHFANAQQEFDSNKLGFWFFLATEVLMFGGLFAGYAILRSQHTEMFYEAHLHLDRIMGATNTVVLICSSLTMALAVRAAQMSNRKHQIMFLSATLAMALMFLVIKYVEYSAKFEHGTLPGLWYTPHGAEYPAQGNLFFGIYFMMTGLHGVHVLAGIIAITWLLVKAVKGQFSRQWSTPMELTGLYWHLVDLVWIFLFPLFYLIG